MTRRFRQLAAATLLLFALAPVSGCKGCGKKSGDGNGEVVEVAGIEAMPQGVRAVAGARIDKLTESPLIKRAVEQMLLRDPELEGRIRELAKTCSFDPTKEISSVLVGMGEKPDEAVLVATGKFSKEAQTKIASCMSHYASQGGGHVTTRSAQGRNTYKFESGGGEGGKPSEALYYAFGSETTLVIAASAEWLDKALSHSAPVSAEPEFKALLARVDDKSALWAVGRVPPEVGKQLIDTVGGKLSAPPRAMFAHLDLSAGVRGQLGVEMATAEDAKAVVSLAQPQLAALALFAQRYKAGRLVNKIEVASEGPTVYLRLALSDSEVRELAALVDTDSGDGQYAGPPPEQGATKDDQRDAAPDSKAPVR